MTKQIDLTNDKTVLAIASVVFSRPVKSIVPQGRRADYARLVLTSGSVSLHVSISIPGTGAIVATLSNGQSIGWDADRVIARGATV